MHLKKNRTLNFYFHLNISLCTIITNKSTKNFYEKMLDISFILPTYLRQVGPSSERKCSIQSTDTEDLSSSFIPSSRSEHAVYFTYLQQTWQYSKRVFIIQELRSTIIYLQPLKICLVIRINSN